MWGVVGYSQAVRAESEVAHRGEVAGPRVLDVVCHQRLTDQTVVLLTSLQGANTQLLHTISSTVQPLLSKPLLSERLGYQIG